MAPPDQTALTEATRDAHAALSATGAARISSRPLAGGGYPEGTVLTEVRLQLQHDVAPVIAALRGLPRLIDLWIEREPADRSIVVVRSSSPTIFGPGGRDGLTVREAVRQSRLIHPDWSPASHVDWLVEDGYPLQHLERSAAEAIVMQWLGEPQPPHHLVAASDNPDDAFLSQPRGDSDHARQPGQASVGAQLHPGDGVDRLNTPGLPQVPAGGRLLPADEAVELLVTGNHPDSGRGNLLLDAALVHGIRSGHIVACLLIDGRIVFTRPAG